MNGFFNWQEDRCQRVVLSSKKLRKVFFYIRSTFSVTNFGKPKTLNLLRQIIRPKWRTAVTSRFGSGLILKISPGQEAQQNADMPVGIQALGWFPVSIAARELAWSGPLTCSVGLSESTRAPQLSKYKLNFIYEQNARELCDSSITNEREKTGQIRPLI